ncbi:MAG TPA: hypothetical protein PLK94_05690 [Alphaproteobacteria bacterium]|nr:hypothetical protein [Alphaproteobacteria bacterium]HOO50768.1 hypothetical protein [Alphaproteobacteria bacterium]
MFEFQARLISNELHSGSRVRILRFSPISIDSATFPLHQAGQYALLHFDGHMARPYSIANRADGEILEFHVRVGDHPQTGVRSYIDRDLSVGDIVDVTGFSGGCLYQSDCNRSIALIGGGTGVAPLMAIAEAALSDNPDRDVVLFHGGRTTEDFYLHDYFLNLQNLFPRFKSYAVVSGLEKDQGVYLAGLVGDVAFRELSRTHDLKSMRFYASGPVEMVRHVHDLASSFLIDPEFIHTDLDSFNQFSNTEQDKSP